ncbi:restriction endonuclease type II-like protein [Blastocladiella britannica]|nr:restriction endonuclease type II-like protein [Blastocladiella britannica]
MSAAMPRATALPRAATVPALTRTAPPPPPPPPLSQPPPPQPRPVDGNVFLDITESPLPELAPWPPQPVQVLPPDSFEVVLVLDVREHSRKDREFFQRALVREGVMVETMPLPVGDMVWAVRPKGSTTGSSGLVLLDYIAERKRIDDLVTSIRDNRWVEQKWRMEGSGLANRLYIVEESQYHAIHHQRDSVMVKAVQTAKSQTIAWSDFNLHVTRSDEETVDMLAQTTRLISQLWRGRPLYYLRPTDVPDRALWVKLRREGTVDPVRRVLVPMTPDQLATAQYRPGAIAQCAVAPHITMAMLNGFSGKSSNVQLRDIFTRMLMTVQGVSSEKARFLVRHFETPASLYDAYQQIPESDRPTFLSDLCDAVEKEQGLLGRKKVTPALSKRIAEVFTAQEYREAVVRGPSSQSQSQSSSSLTASMSQSTA